MTSLRTVSHFRAPSVLRSPRPPKIVAEALSFVPDPLETVLVPGPAAPADAVCRAIAWSLAPPEAPTSAPDWLMPEQVAPFRRALAAIARHGGALLADPVGSGKTWIALAVAAALAPEGGATAVVPAALASQWVATARRVGLALTIVSHERVSRGRIPVGRNDLLIIDESHRFRNPSTRRYAHLARGLIGRRVLLLSATPVVNRLEDLAHQLLLAVPDDALVARGCPSLLSALRAASPPAALGDLVLCRPAPRAAPVALTRRVTLPLTRAETELLGALESLEFSRDPGVAALMRVTFWRALASSPGAFAGALGRYRRLLHHAATAGRAVTRAAIRAFTGADPEQLLLWDLLPDLAGSIELCLEDREALVTLDARARQAAALLDARSAVLRAVLGDGTPSLVFTSSRDTLDWLRTRLADLRPAWVTGDGAGIGSTRMRRESVLGWFRPGTAIGEAGADGGSRNSSSAQSGPRVLLATDVAAEGLDLQRAERIVHYDLPWTSVRLDQRAGRALRLGAVRDTVEILEFAPPAELESRLRQLERLGEKRRLGSAAGIGADGRWLYRWRSELETGYGERVGGMAAVHGDECGWLVGLALDLALPDGGVVAAPATLLWIGDDGVVTEDPASCVRQLQSARELSGRPPTAAERVAAVGVIAPVARAKLRAAHADGWRLHPAHELVRLTRRLRRIAAAAARARDRERFVLAGRALEWLTGGLTAGERALAGEIAAWPDPRLLRALPGLVLRPRVRGIPFPRLIGIVRVTTFPACQPSAPCSSISTAP